MPFTRSYSLEDIGYVPRGAHLNFDAFGRVAVIHDGVYAVLNDTTWLNIAGRDKDRIAMLDVVTAADGRMYYGGLASWGAVEMKPDGLLHVAPLPGQGSAVPEWTHSSSFDDVITTSDGVYFCGARGVIFWDIQRKETRYYECNRIARAFRIGRRIYLSAFDKPLQYIDPEQPTLQRARASDLDVTVVQNATTLDGTHALLSLLDGRLVAFDGVNLSSWPAPSGNGMERSPSVLLQLADNNIAVGVTGSGLYIFSAEGELLLKLDSPEYQRITALACREPGVLWAATENSIEKVLYSSALTVFGQQLGLTLGWPIVEKWRGTIYVASEGKLYRAVEGAPGAPSHFELYPGQPRGVWALAAFGPRMLVGGTDEVYSVADDGRLELVTRLQDVAHLIMFDADHCYAIGRSEIGLLEWRDGKWTETMVRTRGVTYPSVAHRSSDSVWVEMAGQVGHLQVKDGHLQFDTIPNASWTQSPWVNVGTIGSLVIFGGNPGERRFFDENSDRWVESPKYQNLLNRSPVWISRLEQDDSGTLWATHDDGVVRFTPRGAEYEIDTNTFDFINDRYPQLHVLPGNDIWISASRSLYHVEHRWSHETKSPLKPILVSVMNGDAGELLTDAAALSQGFTLPFARNNLSFRFFSGSYAERRAPSYEYRLSDRESWTSLSGAQLIFRGLHDGEYSMQVRTTQRPGTSGPMAIVPFQILPPWYRTWVAYIIFGSGVSLLLIGAMRWSTYMERKRSQALEKLVDERTHQLKTAMTKLNEESRNAAILAERNRLANEIHDSVQQGLTGAILQLDTTLKLQEFRDELRERLDVVRNMISYARQEVQHAVWDMESPLLEGNELASALKNLVAFINAEGAAIDVSVEGEEIPLGRTLSHNLLRIAQEATTNAIRHAHAQRIAIKLIYKAESVSLSITDNGVGFSPGEVLQNRTGHLGLRGIRTRVKRLRGKLSIDSAPDRGTSIYIEAPLPTKEELAAI